MHFLNVAEASAAVAATRSRKKKIAALTQCLSCTPRDQLAIVTSWLTGTLPQGRLGLGPALLREVANTPPGAVPGATVMQVHGVLDQLAAVSGKGARQRRLDLLASLLSDLPETGQAFLFRLLLGELRQGALDGVMIEAIASAAELPPAKVRRAVMVSGDVAAVARVALTDDGDGIDQFKMRPGTPLQPMLAQTADDVEAALQQLGNAVFDYKLDGVRVQVHRDGSRVLVFTRHLNDVTARLPEVVEAVLALDTTQLILDGEVIALRDDHRPHPFQVTMQRFGKKLDLQQVQQELPLSVFFFDLLFDGNDLTESPALERFGAMHKLLPPSNLIPRLQTDDPAEAQQFMDAALAAGHEGLMAKSPGSDYAAGSRGADWLKIKQTHTLDLVVLAAEWGSGRRSGWLSNLHLGARDPDNNGFVMLGKTFKGLTDEMLEWQTKRFLELETRRDGHIVFVQPEVVVEIAFNELQNSRQYPGGLALRFARVKAFREDKPAAEADTIKTVRQLFASQHG